MVQGRDDIVGLDSAVILPREVWEASGHVADVRRPADRVPVLPQALPRRPPQEEYEEQARARPGRAAWPMVACPNCGTRGAWTEPRMFNGLLKTYLGADRGRVGPALPAPRDRAGHLHQLPQRAADRRGRSRRSASRRSASASATRSPRATSSSAPASSSRWRWSSSSSPAPTRNGTSTGSTTRAGLVRRPRHRPRTTCASSSTRRRSSRTTPSAPSTSSTASASPAASGASSKASPTAPTSTCTTHSEHSGAGPVLLRPGRPASATCPYVIEPAAGLTRA